MRAMTLGDVAACDAAIAEAEEIAARAQDVNVARTIAAHRVWMNLILDRPDELLRDEAKTMAAMRTMGPTLPQVLRTAIRFRAGDLASAGRRSTRSIRRCRSRPSPRSRRSPSRSPHSARPR